MDQSSSYTKSLCNIIKQIYKENSEKRKWKKKLKFACMHYELFQTEIKIKAR